MTEHKAILEGTEVVPCENTITWARWNDNPANRRVAYNRVADVVVSTVFLGIDHSFGNGKPLWFETMIFGGKHDETAWRYTSYEEAIYGHQEAIRLAHDV